jgi:endonuclease YncB( thermonuclease family)
VRKLAIPARGPRIGLLLLVGVAGYIAASASGSPPAATRVQALGARSSGTPARVTRIIDGDTLVARIDRRSEHVRLIGIDASKARDCYGAQATAAARRLALNRLVTLVRDPTQSRRDRYNRILAYVMLPSSAI